MISSLVITDTQALAVISAGAMAHQVTPEAYLQRLLGRIAADVLDELSDSVDTVLDSLRPPGMGEAEYRAILVQRSLQ